MSAGIMFPAAALVSFAIAALIAYPVLTLMRKLKAGQTVLVYVDKHSGKSGTPTIGGIIFLAAAVITCAIFGGMDFSFCAVACAVTAAYALLGFLDDFIKVRFKHNQGLKAYQKIVGQAGIAVLVTVFSYRNRYISDTVNLPFTTAEFNMGWAFIPFTMILFIAVTNAVNLTDGLDGLVAKSAASNMIVLTLVCGYMLAATVPESDVLLRGQVQSMGLFCASLAGALFAFIWLNASPASIFMGDTGSLALGGAVTCAAVFLKIPFILVFIGIMYMVSCISVIVQVLVYKLKGRRVFLMAPFHHHLEYKGVKESKIVTYYTLITTVGGVIGLISCMAAEYV